MTTRRSFLATTGLAAAGLLSGVSRLDAAEEKPSARKFGGPHELPKNVTLLSIDQGDGTETLGVKTATGVLDVKKAARLLGLIAPLTLDELLKNGSAASLNKLIMAASHSAKAKAAYVDEAKIKHGRLFIKPGKIVCVGLNYKRHAQEIGMKEPGFPRSSTSSTTPWPRTTASSRCLPGKSPSSSTTKPSCLSSWARRPGMSRKQTR